jgi:hypothetical protein
VRLPQLAHSFLAVSHHHERAGETASDARRLGWKRDCFELIHRRSQEFYGSSRIVVTMPRQQTIARICVCETETMVQAPSISSHSRGVQRCAIEITRRQSRLAHEWKQPLQ